MTTDQNNATFHKWAHAPPHLFAPNAMYMVTAGTYLKAMLFDTDKKLDFLLQTLFDETDQWGWQLQAWAAMANHYHFIAQAPEKSETLSRMISVLHSKTAIWLNKMDGMPGRKVWFQYRDTCLTYERSYLARLNYVHHNPVKHGLVAKAEFYPWCSMAWFMLEAELEFRQKVLSLKLDNVKIADGF